MMFQVAEVVVIADKHGWVKPTVYQGLYNAIERTVEVEYVHPKDRRGWLTMILFEQTLALPEALWNPILRLQSARVRRR